VTFWYSGVLLVALLVFGGSLWVAVRHNVLSGIERQLRTQPKGFGQSSKMRLISPTSTRNDGIRARCFGLGSSAGPRRIRERTAADAGLLSIDPRDPERYRTHSERVSVKGRNLRSKPECHWPRRHRMLTQLRAMLLIAIPFVVAVAFWGGTGLAGGLFRRR
jgi:hypothetical protein